MSNNMQSTQVDSSGGEVLSTLRHIEGSGPDEQLSHRLFKNSALQNSNFGPAQEPSEGDIQRFRIMSGHTLSSEQGSQGTVGRNGGRNGVLNKTVRVDPKAANVLELDMGHESELSS